MGIPVSDIIADLRTAHVRTHQQLLRLFKTHTRQILTEGRACFLAEQRAEIARADIYHSCCLIHGKFVILEVFKNTPFGRFY